ncbi:MAG: galactokinase, partial [Planctomycetes bacterium]|nr:galactokinase [Planctomycetota bacterium]
QFLQEAGARLAGFDGVIQGNVPIGSGVSSSAAMEVASAMAWTHLLGLTFEKKALALLCQKAENKFVGVNCGIMDQFVSVFGAAGHAVLIDCRSLQHELVPFDASRAVVLVCNTGVKRELATSAYNERRAQCEEAVRRLSRRYAGISALRDVSVAQFQAAADDLPQPVRRRARHVVTENQRALDSVQALRQGNLAEFGRLMNESHESLRHDYEVTCRELDVMVDLARSVRGTYGSRMTGAGFGGCTVSLVSPDAVDEFRQRVAAGYREAIGLAADISVVVPADGAGRVA